MTNCFFTKSVSIFADPKVWEFLLLLIKMIVLYSDNLSDFAATFLEYFVSVPIWNLQLTVDC